MMFLLISMFGKNALIPFAADFVLGLCLVITGTWAGYTEYVLPKVIHPYSLLDSRLLFGKTEFVNIAGYPVFSYMAAAASALIAGFAACTAVMVLSKENVYC